MGAAQSSPSIEKSKKSCTSFGSVDPRKQFLIDIKTNRNLPAWDRLYDFNVYQTAKEEKGAFDHSYIAICAVDDAIQSKYLCIHLFLDGDQKIFPKAKFMTTQEATAKVINNSLSQKYKIKNVSMRQFTKLALDLIENHGKYNTTTNNCQTFVSSFLSKLQSYSDAMANFMAYGTPNPTVHQVATATRAKKSGAATGAVGGTVGGMAAGGLGAVAVSIPAISVEVGASGALTYIVGAPILALSGPAVVGCLVGGAVIGAVGGAVIGGAGCNLSASAVNLATSGSMSVAQKSAGNKTRKVDDKQALREKTELEWINWEHRIWNL